MCPTYFFPAPCPLVHVSAAPEVRVRIWWQESTLISTLAVFISVHSPGDFEVCLFCFLLIFFQGTFLLPVREAIQLCWAKGSSGALKMLKTLCTPECLLKKSQITQLSVGCAKGFTPCRYKISSTLPSRAQNCSQCTNSSPTRQKLALEIESTESRVSSPINHQDLLLIHKIALATSSLCILYRILFLFLKLFLYPYTLQCPLWTGKSQASERRSWWKKKNCNWTTHPLLKWIRPVNQNHHQWWGVWLKISRKNMEWLIL